MIFMIDDHLTNALFNGIYRIQKTVQTKTENKIIMMRMFDERESDLLIATTTAPVAVYF